MQKAIVAGVLILGVVQSRAQAQNWPSNELMGSGWIFRKICADGTATAEQQTTGF